MITVILRVSTRRDIVHFDLLCPCSKSRNSDFSLVLRHAHGLLRNRHRLTGFAGGRKEIGPMRKSAVSIVAALACATLAVGCSGTVSGGSNGSEDDSAFTVAEPVAARQSTGPSLAGGSIDVDALA